MGRPSASIGNVEASRSRWYAGFMTRQLACAATILALLMLEGCSATGDGSTGPGGGGAAATEAGSGATGGGTGATGGGTGATGSGGGSTGSGEIGEPCATDADCTDPPDAECWTTIGGGPVPTITFPGGYCSKACGDDGGANECGESGGCSSTSMSGGGSSVTLQMCRAPCQSNEECRAAEGYRCQIVIPGFGVCVPP